MERMLIHIEEYANRKSMILEAADDIKCRFDTMIQKVMNESKTPCCISTIPDEYYKEFGIRKIVIPEYTYSDCVLVKDKLEENGISIACCRDCNSFDEGGCFKYGGLCDPECEGNDCLHADDIYSLRYGEEHICYVHLYATIEADKVAALVKEHRPDLTENIQEYNEEDIEYDAVGWELVKTV